MQKYETVSKLSAIEFKRLYCSRPETWNLDRAKAPRITDHKSPYIVNILRLMIDDPRELSRRSKSKFQADCSITGVQKDTFAKMISVVRKAASSRMSRGGKPAHLSIKDRLLMSLEY